MNRDDTKETMQLPDRWDARADGETTGGLTAYIRALRSRDVPVLADDEPPAGGNSRG